MLLGNNATPMHTRMQNITLNAEQRCVRKSPVFHRLLCLLKMFFFFYAPNFEKVEGEYCFGLVRPSVTNLRYGFEIS